MYFTPDEGLWVKYFVWPFRLEKLSSQTKEGNITTHLDFWNWELFTFIKNKSFKKQLSYSEIINIQTWILVAEHFSPPALIVTLYTAILSVRQCGLSKSQRNLNWALPSTTLRWFLLLLLNILTYFYFHS